MKVKILVDNYVTGRGLLAEHGFSIFIEDERQKYIFDTGQGMTLLHNMEVFNLKLADIDKVILSHGHDDHTGGLHFFKEANVLPELIAHPDIIYPKFKIQGQVKKNIGLKITLDGFNLNFSKDPVNINKRIIFSGEVPKWNKWELEETAYYREKEGQLEQDPFSDDSSIYVKLNNGLLVLTGCAHSGIINIIQYGMKITGITKLYGIIGGMHLKNASRGRINKTIKYIKELNPEFVTISHCTGLIAGSIFRKEMGGKIIFTDIGKEFTF
jgi:7,8-dihydropterin-6-yl-methyl-4-(beta-D-ribofuranosyl)aminobenzene 5'-phosphate synthase